MRTHFGFRLNEGGKRRYFVRWNIEFDMGSRVYTISSACVRRVCLVCFHHCQQRARGVSFLGASMLPLWCDHCYRVKLEFVFLLICMARSLRRRMKKKSRPNNQRWTVVLVGDTKPADTFEISQFLLVFRFRLHPTEAFVVTPSHDDYSICSSTLLLLCPPPVVPEKEMCASIIHNSNKFSSYLALLQPRPIRPLIPFGKIAKWRQLDATFGKMKNYQNDSDVLVGAAAAVVVLIQLRLRKSTVWANTTNLRTDWQIIQYYSFRRENSKTTNDEKKTENFSMIFCRCRFYSLQLINRTKGDPNPEPTTIQLVANGLDSTPSSTPALATQNSME